MSLTLRPPIRPMLASAASTIPAGQVYEPKWDGYRCLIFRHHDDVMLQSRRGSDLTGHFPDIVDAVLDNTPPRCILDGELVVIHQGRLDIAKVQERAHPSGHSDRLAAAWPASFVAFDVLALDSTDLTGSPFARRREQLETALGHAEAPILLSPTTTDLSVAMAWFDQFEGAGLDGVVAKDPDGAYRPGVRGWTKVKHRRDADVVVGGYRLGGEATAGVHGIGSLQLGLYDADGRLCWIGACSNFTGAQRLALLDVLRELEVPQDQLASHPWGGPVVPDGPRLPTTQSWRIRDQHVHLLDPILVAEVRYDAVEGDRFRSAATFLRWRPDRDAASCRMDQLHVTPTWELSQMLGE